MQLTPVLSCFTKKNARIFTGHSFQVFCYEIQPLIMSDDLCPQRCNSIACNAFGKNSIDFPRL